MEARHKCCPARPKGLVREQVCLFVEECGDKLFPRNHPDP